MNSRVTLVATGIQVTATTQSRAMDYLREDAAQFRSQWDYQDDDVEPTDDEITEDGDDAEIDVSVEDAAGRGERLWTGEARFTVVVAGSEDAGAYAAARQLLAA